MGTRRRARYDSSTTIDVELKRLVFSRICVAVDGSSAAEAVARGAISLAAHHEEAEITFVHVINIPAMAGRADRFNDDYALALSCARENARAVLAKCCALAHDANVFARSYVRFGSPATEIRLFAQSIGADVVVIGNPSTTRLHRFCFGSTRDEIVHTCAIPVLAIS